MMRRRIGERTDHSGSSFNSFLEEEGIREEVEALAIKRVLEQKLLRAKGPKIEIPLAEIRHRGLVSAVRERPRRR